MNRMITLGAIVSLATLTLPCAQALDGVWKADAGSGNWSDQNRWKDLQVAAGSGSIASFEVPSSAGGYSITLDEAVTIGELRQLGNGWNSTYTLGGPSVLTFAPGGKIALSSTETSNSFLNGFVINAAVSGTGGLEISGSGRRQFVTWNPSAIGLSGGITLQNAGLQVNRAAALGSNTVTLSGTGLSFLGFAAPEEGAPAPVYGSAVVLDGSASGFMNFIGGGSTTIEPATHSISGNISQSAGADKGIYYMTATNTARGARFVISGENSYRGSTWISSSSIAGVNMNTGPIVVRAASDQAFGVGTGAVIQILNAASGIELEGGITISDKVVRLNGEGFRGNGSVNSVSGNNTWTGNVVLRHGTDRGVKPTIGVESGQLTISGVISDGQTSDGLHKVGVGSLVLTGANTYATGTKLLEGVLMANHNNALGTGGVLLDGGTLVVGQGRSIQNAISFAAQGGALGGTGRIGSQVALNGVNQRLTPGTSAGVLEFAGGQSWSAFTYEWEMIDGSGLEGTFDQVAVDGALALDPSGEYRLELAGGVPVDFDEAMNRNWTILTTLDLSGFDNSGWTLSGFELAGSGVWNLGQQGANLVLSYQAVPEPGAVVSLLLGVGMLYGYRRRKNSL